MELNGRPPIALTESQIRYAMYNTYSNQQAARFLNLAYNTYKKYAKSYIDTETGLTLFQLHLKKSSGQPKKKRPETDALDTRHWNSGYKERLEDILAGQYPWYQPRKLRKRLFASNYMPLICSGCGWCEARVTDNNVPLLLAFKDGNWRNKLIDNIYLLCFNCYFMRVGSQGHYWQGMTYGTKRKPRGDGKPKGWKGRLKEQLKADGIANNILGTDQI